MAEKKKIGVTDDNLDIQTDKNKQTNTYTVGIIIICLGEMVIAGLSVLHYTNGI